MIVGEDMVHARMASRAQIQVRAAWESKKVLLDFTPESLTILDDLIASDVARRPKDPEALSEIIGAYLGEVVARRLGARWQGSEDAPRLNLQGTTLDPVEAALRRVTQGRRQSLMVFYNDAAAGVGLPGTEAARKGLRQRLWGRKA